MSGQRKYEIQAATGGGIQIRIVNPTNPNPWEYYKASAIKSITGVDIAGYGTRDVVTNQRKHPVRHTDKREFMVNFHDENETSPLRYNIEDVANQAGWTNDTAGLLQALEDLNSWTLGAGAVITGVLTGNTETPSTVENAASGAGGTTTSGVKAFSILFEGTGGQISGVDVDSGYSSGKAASLSNVLGSQAYTVPNVADADFPFSPRVLIEYIT